MNSPFERKGIFSWKVKDVEGGDPVRFARALKAAGFEAVYVKVADGASRYKVWRGVLYVENVSHELVDALRAQGLAVIGWGFLYGKDPLGEARVAVEQVKRFALDGYIFDVEGAFDAQPNAADNARDIMHYFKANCPDTPTAFCWWYMWHQANQPTKLWHPDSVAKAWLEKVDYGMPMCYWGGSTAVSALWYIEETHKQWRELTNKPIVMVGRAYTGDGGIATPDGIVAFERRTRELKCAGISWWSLDAAYNKLPVWAYLIQTPGWKQEEVTPPIVQPAPVTPPDDALAILWADYLARQG